MSRNFTNYEYEGLVEHITNLYKNKEGLGEGYETTIGQTLISLLADASDNLHYMLERRTQESYISIARLQSSIWAAASGIGYAPRRKVSATGTLKLVLVDDDGLPRPALGNIQIPFGKEVTFDGTSFIVTDDYVIEPGMTEIDISIKEGTQQTELYAFSEEPYLTDNFIEIPNYWDIEEYSLRVVADNGTYSSVLEYDDSGLRIRAISFADNTMPVYDIKYINDGMRIVFGDDIFGVKPQGNVEVSYVLSSGDEVNIINTNLEFSFSEEVLYDDVVVTPQNEYQYTLKNITPIRGGMEEETIEDIRENVTAFVRANDRAVTNFDYEFWVRRSGIGNITDVKAYGEHETNRLIFTMNNVYITYATPDRLPLNSEQVEALRDYLNRVKVNTTHLVFRPVVPIYLALDIDFKAHPALPIATAQLYRILVDYIEDYFKIGRGSIGKEFQHSEFVEYLQNLTFTFNNVNYPLTDFVWVDIEGMIPIDLPQPIYDGVLELSNDYVVVSNQVWTVTIDGDSYTVVTTSSDTVTSLVDKMQNLINTSTGLMTARPANNQIRIRHPQDQGTYEITFGSGDLNQYTRFLQYIDIPKSTNDYNPNIDVILPGSVKLVDEDNNIIMEDDGNGLLVSEGGTYPSVVIDYSEGNIEYPMVPERTYYLKFKQNEFSNYSVTREGVVDMMKIQRVGDPDNVYYFSKLNLLGR